MVKGTKRFLLVSVAAIVAVCVGAVPAQAASTRTDYIAQVDPICAASAPVISQAYGSYSRNYKRWAHLASHGTLKGWVKQTRRTGASLSRFNQAEARLTDQLAAIPPAPGDESTIGSWLSYRRQAEALGGAAANALSHIQVGKFFKLAGRGDKAAVAGVRVAEGVGFQVCDQIY
jgi:hypothetical protein